MARTKEITEVEVGQLWADNDPRSKGRIIEIVRIDDRHVTGRVVTNCKDFLRSSVGRLTRIRKDRLKPTDNGYRLIS